MELRILNISKNGPIQIQAGKNDVPRFGGSIWFDDQYENVWDFKIWNFLDYNVESGNDWFRFAVQCNFRMLERNGGNIDDVQTQDVFINHAVGMSWDIFSEAVVEHKIPYSVNKLMEDERARMTHELLTMYIKFKEMFPGEVPPEFN